MTVERPLRRAQERINRGLECGGNSGDREKYMDLRFWRISPTGLTCGLDVGNGEQHQG
jgi:hypothetical protein